MTKRDALPIKAVWSSFFLELLPILALAIPILFYFSWILDGTLRREADVLAWIADTRPLTDLVQGLLSHRAFLPDNAWISGGIGPVQALEHLDVATGIYGIAAAVPIIGIKWFLMRHRNQRVPGSGAMTDRTGVTLCSFAWLSDGLFVLIAFFWFSDILLSLGIDPSWVPWLKGPEEPILSNPGGTFVLAFVTVIAMVAFSKRKTAAEPNGPVEETVDPRGSRPTFGTAYRRFVHHPMMGRLLPWASVAVFGYLFVHSGWVLSPAPYVMAADEYVDRLLSAIIMNAAFPLVIALNIFDGILASHPGSPGQRDATPKT